MAIELTTDQEKEAKEFKKSKEVEILGDMAHPQREPGAAQPTESKQRD